MFDLSLVELAVIALVALLVLGPQRLPRAARTVGMYARRARQSWYTLRADIERELAADEMRRSVQEQAEAAERAAASLRREIAGPSAAAPDETPAPGQAPGAADTQAHADGSVRADAGDSDAAARTQTGQRPPVS